MPKATLLETKTSRLKHCRYCYLYRFNIIDADADDNIKITDNDNNNNDDNHNDDNNNNYNNNKQYNCSNNNDNNNIITKTKILITIIMIKITTTTIILILILDDMYQRYHDPWWRHQMETFSALLTLCVGNSPVTGEFTSQRPVTQSVGVIFFICTWKNGWVNTRVAGDLIRHRTRYDVIVMPNRVVQIEDVFGFCRRFDMRPNNYVGIQTWAMYNHCNCHCVYVTPHFIALRYVACRVCTILTWVTAITKYFLNWK